jgi:hypothetical protein
MKKIVQISVTVTILSMFFLSLAYADKWAAAKNLSNNEGDSYDPAIAADGLNLYVVWSGGYDIYFKRSENGGASWKPVRQITGTSAAAHKPVIAVDGLNIYVAWYEKIQPGYYDIYFTRSSNGGATWKPKQQFANISFGVLPAGSGREWLQDLSGIFCIQIGKA